MNKIKVAILGYGNLGRGVESAVSAASDMELCALFTRRDPESIKTESGVSVYHIDEAMIMSIVSIIGIVWTAMILIVGLSQVHQYYIGKTVVTVALSVFAMIIIAVLLFLLFSLVQQVLYFFTAIVEELRLR